MEGENVNPATKAGIDEDLQLRYSHWKKNTKLLYDYLNTNTSKWPSLTCQFFPDLDTATDTHRLLLSSFTSSQLPQDENIYIATLSTLKHLNWANLNNFDMEELEFKPDNSTKFPPKHLTTNLTVNFPSGDCNRARYMPQNPDVIAGASSDGSIYIFDRTKHGSRRLRKSIHSHSDIHVDEENNITNLNQMDSIDGINANIHYEAKFNDNKVIVDNLESNENENEAVSLSWNLQKEGTLVAAYSQGSVKTWDLKKYDTKNKNSNKPEWNIEQFDPQGCNDVNWMPFHDSLFVASGESSDALALFDIRMKKEISRIRSDYHNDGINACKFNFGNSMLLASADNEGKINMWDIRNLESSPIMTLNHGSSVSTIEWNPNVHNILASAGQQDGLVKLWDISQDGEDDSNKLVFVHAGHMLGVNDISWDLHDPWLISSVSNDNSIHIWKPSANIVQSA